MSLNFSFIFSFSLFLCDPFWKIPLVWSPISQTHFWAVLRFNSSIEFLFQLHYFSLPNLLICYFYIHPFLFDEAISSFISLRIWKYPSVLSWPSLVLAACPSGCWSFSSGQTCLYGMWWCLERYPLVSSAWKLAGAVLWALTTRGSHALAPATCGHFSARHSPGWAA